MHHQRSVHQPVYTFPSFIHSWIKAITDFFFSTCAGFCWVTSTKAIIATVSVGVCYESLHCVSMCKTKTKFIHSLIIPLWWLRRWPPLPRWGLCRLLAVLAAVGWWTAHVAGRGEKKTPALSDSDLFPSGVLCLRYRFWSLLSSTGYNVVYNLYLFWL